MNTKESKDLKVKLHLAVNKVLSDNKSELKNKFSKVIKKSISRIVKKTNRKLISSKK